MGADEPVESVDIRPSDRIRSEWRPNESALEGTVAIVNLLLFFSVKSSPNEEEEDDLWLAALLPSPRKLPRKLKVGILLLVEVAVPPFMTWILWQLLASLVVLYPSSEMSDPLSPPPPPPPAVVVVVVVVLVLFGLLLPPPPPQLLLLPPAAVA